MAVVFSGLVGFWLAAVLMIRVGYWPRLAQFAVARLNAWVIAVLVLGGAIHAAQEFVVGTVNLIVALLAFVVARSELPESLANRAAPTPRSKTDPPIPTHFLDGRCTRTGCHRGGVDHEPPAHICGVGARTGG